jgi:hypothetical protein
VLLVIERRGWTAGRFLWCGACGFGLPYLPGRTEVELPPPPLDELLERSNPRAARFHAAWNELEASLKEGRREPPEELERQRRLAGELLAESDGGATAELQALREGVERWRDLDRPERRRWLSELDSWLAAHWRRVQARWVTGGLARLIPQYGALGLALGLASIGAALVWLFGFWLGRLDVPPMRWPVLAGVASFLLAALCLWLHATRYRRWFRRTFIPRAAALEADFGLILEELENANASRGSCAPRSIRRFARKRRLLARLLEDLRLQRGGAPPRTRR